MTVYRSIFAQRTRPVEPRDFASVPDMVVTTVQGSINTPKSNMEKWENRVPFLPQDIHAVFHASFGDEAGLRVEFDEQNPRATTLKITHGSSVDPLYSGILFFEHGFHQMPDSSIRVTPGYQGRGIGKKWFRFANEICALSGFDKRTFMASTENGGYTWARAGAHLDGSVYASPKREHVLETLVSRLDVIKPYIPIKTYRSVYPYCRLLAPDDVCRIADNDYVLPSDFCDDMSKQGNTRFMHDLKKHFNDHSEEALTAFQTHAENVTKNACAQNKPLTLGRFLLTGTSWHAQVDFSNAAQMQRIGNYIGGWKTIAPHDDLKTPNIQIKPAPVGYQARVG